MRTTVNLPDDVYQAARELGQLRGISLGEAIGELVRAGVRPRTRVATKRGFPCFQVPADGRQITLEQTLAAEDEL